MATARRKKTAAQPKAKNGANGASGEYLVGQVIQFAGDDVATARAAWDRITALKVQLAELELQHDATKAAVLAAIRRVSEEHKVVVTNIGRKFTDMNQGKWAFSPDESTWTRTA